MLDSLRSVLKPAYPDADFHNLMRYQDIFILLHGCCSAIIRDVPQKSFYRFKDFSASDVDLGHAFGRVPKLV